MAGRLPGEGLVSDLLPTTVFSTDSFAPADRLDAWRESIGVLYEVEPAAPGPLYGSVDAWHFGDRLVAATSFSAQSYRRSAGRILSDGVDHYLLQLYREGGLAGDADGRPLRLGAGAVCLFDLARPCVTAEAASSTVSLIVPRDLVDAGKADRNLHGLVIGGARGALLADYLASLARRLPSLTTSDAAMVTRLTQEMVTACLPIEARALSAQREAVLLVRAKRYIDAELCSFELTPDRICGALAVSRDALYRAFEPVGGVAAWVRNRRLDRVHALLVSTGETRRIADLAYDHGFQSEAHFSRAFRTRFGYSPRDIRHLALAGMAPGIRGWRPGGYEDWVRQLRA